MKALTRFVGHIVQRQTGSSKLDRELVSHAMEVTNRFLNKVRDNVFTKQERKETWALLRRFVQVWQSYEQQKDDSREDLIDLLSQMEAWFQ